MKAKKIIAILLIIMVSILTIAMSKEKRTVVIQNKHNNNQSINKHSTSLVPSDRWKWSSRWQIGSTSRWNLYNLNKDTAGKWVMPWSTSNKYHYSNINYRGYYGSMIPVAPRISYRYKSFRPHYYFGRFRNYQRYYPYGYFHYHLYPRYFTSYWAYPFWTWHWYPSWWINYDCRFYYPSYYYYEYWYPRHYYRPNNPYENKYFARILIDIQPEKASVYVDDTYIGLAKDYNGWWLAYPVKAGKHKIDIKYPGYQPYSMNIELAPKQFYELKYKMQRTSQNTKYNLDYQYNKHFPKGFLTLEINPSYAEIYINNEYIGNWENIQKNKSKIELPPGKHKITILSPNYMPYHSEIEIKEDENTTLRVELIERQLV